MIKKKIKKPQLIDQLGKNIHRYVTDRKLIIEHLEINNIN